MKSFIKRWGSLLLCAALLLTVFTLGTVMRGKKLRDDEAARQKPAWETVCADYFEGECENLIVADPESPAAFCSGIYASQLGAPVLFTNSVASLRAQSERLGVKNVYMITDSEKFGKLKPAFDADVNVSLIDTQNAALASAELLSKIPTDKEAVFVTCAGDGVDKTAAVSALSVSKEYPIIVTDGEEFCDAAKKYLSESSSLKTAYIIGNAGGKIADFLKSLGKETVIIDDIRVEEVNGRLNRMLLPECQKVITTSRSDCALALGVTEKDNAVFYIPKSISAQQIFYLLENPSAKIGSLSDKEPSLLQTRRVLEGAAKRKFVFDTQNYRGAVFFVPHQDDETLYYQQAITSAIDAYGAQNVYVVLLTDGASSTVKNREEISAPVNEIVAATGLPVSELEKEAVLSAFFSRARTNELLDALSKLGITNIVELCFFKDSALSESMEELKGVIDSYVRGHGGKLAVMSYSPYYDFHSDHRAVGQALLELYNEDPDGTYKGVNFIVRGDEDYNEGFLSAPDEVFENFTMFITDQKNNDKIMNAGNCYGVYSYNAPEIAADIAQTVKTKNCSIASAVMTCDKASALRLAVGIQSVPGPFATLKNRSQQNCLISFIHKPFDINLYGGIEHE